MINGSHRSILCCGRRAVANMAVTWVSVRTRSHKETVVTAIKIGIYPDHHGRPQSRVIVQQLKISRTAGPVRLRTVACDVTILLRRIHCSTRRWRFVIRIFPYRHRCGGQMDQHNDFPRNFNKLKKFYLLVYR